MMQKYQKRKINILLLLITISLWVVHLMQRQRDKTRKVNKFDSNEKIKTLPTKVEIKTLATKAELKAEQDKIVKLQNMI